MVTVGFDFILTSVDGKTWRRESTEFSGRIESMTFGNGRFVARGSATLSQGDGAFFSWATSADGFHWTPRFESFPGVDFITFEGGQFVGAGHGAWWFPRRMDRAGLLTNFRPRTGFEVCSSPVPGPLLLWEATAPTLSRVPSCPRCALSESDWRVFDSRCVVGPVGSTSCKHAPNSRAIRGVTPSS